MRDARTKRPSPIDRMMDAGRKPWHVCNDLRERLIASESVNGHKSTANLSKREVDVLRLVAAGLCNKQIAEKLCLSPHTVCNHRKRMLAKTGCRSGAEMVSLAIREGRI